jgi:hypothetical protein
VAVDGVKAGQINQFGAVGTVGTLSAWTLSAGMTGPRSRFHFPTPSSPYRNPSGPCGTTTVLV